MKSYVGASVRTVQRWEHDYHLRIHRSMYLSHGRNHGHREGVLDHAWSEAEHETLFPIHRWESGRFVRRPNPRVTY